MASARTALVDVCLNNSRPDHSQRRAEKSSRDLLDRGEVDVGLPQSWVNHQIADWDEDDECERVEIGDDVVGNTVQGHGRSLRGEIVVDLIVANPVKRIPEEYRASSPSTSDFVHPVIIECHPFRCTGSEARWLYSFPECAVVEMSIGLDGIGVDSSFHAHEY